MTVVHADLYRVRDAGELEALGLRDWAQRGHLWFVEWPERGAGHLPAPDLQLAFSAGPAAHAIELQARLGPRGAVAGRPRKQSSDGRACLELTPETP